jgi:DNA/RNA endonuclease G (NUC1)
MFERQSRLPLRRTRPQKTNRSSLIRTWRFIATVILIALASVYVAFAAISLSTSIPYTQNFAGMGIPLSNPAPSNLPADFRQDSLSLARSVGSFSAASVQTTFAGGANVSPTAANGSYNFGAGTTSLGDSDRAAGFLSSGAGGISANLYGQFLNNTGVALTGLQISYDVEKYRNGTNPAGFRYQLFYSFDGVTWTNAGANFLTTFLPDANNNGFATAPGATVSVANQTLNVPIANGASFFLAWNYSVVAGNNPANGQALAIDNISVLAIPVVIPTNPAGVGAANPNSVLPGEVSTLTVTVTPGTNPASTGLAVTANLSTIGGSANQQFFDDGSNGGDAVAGDHVFTHTATVAPLTTPGAKSLPFSITDNQSRSATGSISLIVQQPPPPPIVDPRPSVAGTEPLAEGFNAPYDATVTVDFSEPVDVVGNWFSITCTNSGQHNSATVASYNGSKGFHITPNTTFQFGEQCTVTIAHGSVHDQDLDDSSPNTDTLLADHSWTFTVVAAGAPAPHPPSVHLEFGNPSNAVADLQQADNYLMEKPSFALSYNRDKGTPNWVSWHLESDWIGSLPRTDTFRADPAVSPDWYRVQSTDYFASGFDRGQMTPNADRVNVASIPLNQETFLMSNMVPQAPNSNQGPWAGLETFLRTLLPANEIYVVSGPAGIGGSGDNGPATTIANGHVTVPAYTWKVALVLPAGVSDVSRVTAATRTIAVIVPNQNSINSEWHTYLTTVDAVEALTGYDFFANVSDNIENSIEAGTDGNNPPVTENQFAGTAEDVPTEIILNAVSSVLNATFTYTIFSQPTNGVLSGGGPAFTYTPAQNFHGSDSFTFRVNDGSHDSNISTVNITVTEVNDAPSANSQVVTTNSNTPVAITLAGNDLETADLVFEVTVNPAHGTLAGAGPNLTYTPHTNYSGPDSFEFTVRDSGDGASPALTSAAATVSITVKDTVAPAITAPANVTVNTGEGAKSCGTVVTEAQLGTATASDNAGNVSIARNGVPSGSVFPVGTTTITYIATDAAGNSTSATQIVTVIDNTAPTLTVPAPTSVFANGTGKATIPNVVAGTIASDNCGPVTVAQSPLAGTVVGIGSHTITITATDAKGNTRTTITTFTVKDPRLRFSMSASPASVEQGKLAKLDIAYTNTSAERLSVSFKAVYTSPCGSFFLENVGPMLINGGADKSTNVQFHVPKTACVGLYVFTVKVYVEGVFVGTTTGELTVVPAASPLSQNRKR